MCVSHSEVSWVHQHLEHPCFLHQRDTLDITMKSGCTTSAWPARLSNTCTCNSFSLVTSHDLLGWDKHSQHQRHRPLPAETAPHFPWQTTSSAVPLPYCSRLPNNRIKVRISDQCLVSDCWNYIHAHSTAILGNVLDHLQCTDSKFRPLPSC